MPVCTYCRGTKFYEGPHGGDAVNILCANPDCRHWFNDTGPFGLDDLHRIEPTKEELKETKDSAESEHQRALERVYQEGLELRRTGKLARACLQGLLDGNYIYSASVSDLLRLTGWLDGEKG